jgi:hypothetical protein
MRIYLAHDKAEFLARKPPDMPIRVARRASSANIIRDDGRIISLPAYRLSYSFIDGDEEWLYREQRLGVAYGAPIDLSDTLWAEIEPTRNWRLLL